MLLLSYLLDASSDNCPAGIYQKMRKCKAHDFADYVLDPYSRSSEFALYFQQILMDWHEA